MAADRRGRAPVGRRVRTLPDYLRRDRPRVVCFHGMTACRAFARYALGDARAGGALGRQPHTIAGTRVFVVPNPSPANAHFTPGNRRPGTIG
ncbi:MAG: hypothetical protein QN174_11865 [Armatimonadota bacterium]|nr:hypothetical protein [Armatimonadota bacterium]MDR7512493.1 hypothetical protein [Armatimonadota bacterium]